MISNDIPLIVYIVSHLIAILYLTILVSPIFVIRKPLNRLLEKWTPPDKRIPAWGFLLAFSLLIGVAAVWIEYKAIKSFNLGTVLVSVGVWLPLILLAAMGAEDHSGKEIKLTTYYNILALVLGAPLGGLVGGIYFLTGANIIPFQAEIGDLLKSSSGNLCGTIAMSFGVMGIGLLVKNVQDR